MHIWFEKDECKKLWSSSLICQTATLSSEPESGTSYCTTRASVPKSVFLESSHLVFTFIWYHLTPSLLQVSSSLQLASNCHAAKPWFSSTADFRFLTMCLHSSVYTSFMIFNLKPLSRKSCFISLTIIICQKFASSCQNSCQNLPHMRLTPIYMKKTWQNTYQTWPMIYLTL